MINKDIYDKLKQYEHQLGNAYKANYVRALTSKALSDLDAIYQEMFNRSSRIKNGCGHCVLQDMRIMGKEYFDYKDKLELEQIKLSENISTSEDKDQKIDWKAVEEIKQVEIETEPNNVTNSESETKPKRKYNKVTNKNKKD